MLQYTATNIFFILFCLIVGIQTRHRNDCIGMERENTVSFSCKTVNPLWGVCVCVYSM